jgi:hypothetical protein
MASLSRLLVSIFVQHHVSPFDTMIENKLELLSAFCLELSYSVGQQLVYYSPPPTSSLLASTNNGVAWNVPWSLQLVQWVLLLLNMGTVLAFVLAIMYPVCTRVYFYLSNKMKLGSKKEEDPREKDDDEDDDESVSDR